MASPTDDLDCVSCTNMDSSLPRSGERWVTKVLPWSSYNRKCFTNCSSCVLHSKHILRKRSDPPARSSSASTAATCSGPRGACRISLAAGTPGPPGRAKAREEDEETAGVEVEYGSANACGSTAGRALIWANIRVANGAPVEGVVVSGSAPVVPFSPVKRTAARPSSSS
eukprot:CAMPEP_0172688694 /NCGR_PEP_ID=MMETSP1074-20121228/22588_1 /TAXON_ID=2916 /ORGANISM="Ceratium fusus, Strain PA161109" /LENGTH=168 /DNA_ID=CAMNT_0013508387 /DNA_START=826 /DNA_END=1332 /DNA_ORIENTATION=-